MMNIRNFHLKSNLIAFNSQEISLNLSRQIAKKEKIKIQKALFKNSQLRQRPASKQQQQSKICNNCFSTTSKPKNQKTILDFDPPLLQQNNKTIKNRSCTLSPKKMSQKSTLLYQSKPQHHRRRFSDSNVIKKQNKKSIIHSKTRPDAQSQSLLNPQALKRYTADFDIQYQKGNQKSTNFGQTINKIKVFQIDNFFQWNHNQKIIHGSKNGSPFIATLPSKRKNFRTTKSTNLKERKPQNVSVEKKKQKQKIIGNESIVSPQSNQKYENFGRSIHTAASGTARRIDYDKICYSPVSTGFFPQSSIWNRHEQFIKNVQIKPRSYKLLQKGNPTPKSNKLKENPCRPWSPIKPELMIHQLEEEVFPDLRQH